MLEYIYFVKCPDCDCEDQHFDFFDEAKEFALSCLDKKPVITQIEVDRNDFGECVGSQDLGIVWSCPAECADDDCCTNISTDDCCADDFDCVDEFNIDSCCSGNSCCTDDHCDLHADDSSTDSEISRILDKLDSVADNFSRSEKRDAFYEALVEEMEENEDTVECKWCNELFDKSECRYEIDLGYLCPTCEAAIKSRGETLIFREDFQNKKDYIALAAEPFEIPDELVEFEYKNMTAEIYGKQLDVDKWKVYNVKDDYTYKVPVEDVIEDIHTYYLTEEDVSEVPGGLDYLFDAPNLLLERFIYDHIDDLVEKYDKQLKDLYYDRAQEAFEEDFDLEEYDANPNWSVFGMREELSTSKDQKIDQDAHFTTCPECSAVSYDLTESFCVECGFRIDK